MNNFILSIVYGRGLEWLFRPIFNFFIDPVTAAQFAPAVLSLIGAGVQGRAASQAAREQAAQSRANVLDSLRGAAGPSGIAGLAQAMANQATADRARASASI